MKKVAIISLGCSKNLVDSEVMLGCLKKEGFSFVPDPEEADTIIINTCGFIKPARLEAETAIRKSILVKEKSSGKKIVVAGCYVERSKHELKHMFPEVDVWTGVKDFNKIASIVSGRKYRQGSETFLYNHSTPRLITTPISYAYVKISEGCAHACSFCAIPLIKGSYKSRSLASIVEEARILAGQGIKEINLISHDTTWYGRDRGLKNGLAKLLKKLSDVSGLAWIRFLYGFPEEITSELLEVMADSKICRYLDIPFQHADARIIKAMKRRYDGRSALSLLEKIRSKLPDVAIRTSLIVGFPGETRKEFEALKRFVISAGFEHLGVFIYSPEPGTKAFSLGDRISESEKESRRQELMAVQAEISRKKNQLYIGREIEVLIDSRCPGNKHRFMGHARFQAPEVDGKVEITVPASRSRLASPLVMVRIISASTYDLKGIMIE